MIHEVDSALRALIEQEAVGTRDVDVLLDAPTRDWAGRRNAPTIDIYLYDIREDLRRRQRGLINEYDEQHLIRARHLPPRYFKLSYLVTAWTQRPEDEHRLLSALLECFLRHDALPTELLSGPLADLGLPVALSVGLPPPEDRSFADVWSALGGELKPSLDLVISAPTSAGMRFDAAKAVSQPPAIIIGGVGAPEPETAPRRFVGPGRATRGASGGPSGGPSGSASDDEDSGKGRSGGARLTGWEGARARALMLRTVLAQGDDGDSNDSHSEGRTSEEALDQLNRAAADQEPPKQKRTAMRRTATRRPE